MNANEASIISDKSNTAINKQLNTIFGKIKKAAESGKKNIGWSFPTDTLLFSTCEKLLELGYKTEICQGNSIIIKW